MRANDVGCLLTSPALGACVTRSVLCREGLLTSPALGACVTRSVLCREGLLEAGDDSGTGILEFSPDKAGQDVTPLNLDFGEREQRDKEKQHLNSIAGKYPPQVTPT